MILKIQELHCLTNISPLACLTALREHRFLISEIDMKTKCIGDQKEPDDMKIVCSLNEETIWIRRAFIASVNLNPGFCSIPVHSDAYAQCTACKEKLSMAMSDKCNLFSSCQFFPECDDFSCEQDDAQLYFHVEYECLPRKLNNISTLCFSTII